MANGNKITAHFGADVSEVEAGMLQATRATKRYEQAVKATAVNSSSMLGANSAGATKLVSNIKALAGAFGAAGAAAGLVPGIGIAAIGVAAVVKGVSMIRDHYAEIAENAKKAMEFMGRSATRFSEQRERNMDDPEKLEAARIDLEKKRGMLVQLNGKTELQILADREAYEIALIKFQDLTAAAKKKANEEEEKAREKHSKDEDARAKQELDNYARAAEVKKRADDAAKEAADKQAEEFKKMQDDHQKRMEEEANRQEEIDAARYDRAWRFATDEQKIAQVRKEGQKALDAYNKESSSENLLALEKARKKWLDLRDEINGAKKDASSGSAAGETGGRVRGEDGKLRLRGAVVSEEDAARSDATRKRNEALNRDAMRGKIKDAGRVGSTEKGNKTDELLQQIRDSLKPKAIKT